MSNARIERIRSDGAGRGRDVHDRGEVEEFRVGLAELADEAGPGEAGADGVQAAGFEGGAQGGVMESGECFPEEGLGVIGQENVVTVFEGKALGSDGRRDDGGSHGHGLNDFEAGAAADFERDDLQPGAPIVGADIRNSAGDGHAGFVCVSANFGNGILSDEEELQVGDFLEQTIVHLGKVPAQGIDVGVVIHRAAEEQCWVRVARFSRGRLRGEVGDIHSVGDDRDFDSRVDDSTDEGFIVGAADNLEAAAPGQDALVFPEFEQVLQVQEAGFEGEAHAFTFHQLVLEIDAGAIQDERNPGVMPEEILSEHGIEEMGGVVVVFGEDALQLVLDMRERPVSYCGGQRIEQSLWEQFFPGGMFEWNDFDGTAECFENWGVLEGAAFFGQRDEVDLVFISEGFEEMKAAVVSSSIERVRKVRVKGEDSH